MVEQLDFNKINAEPKTNTLSLENENVVIQRAEPHVVVESQYYSAARAIELIENLRSGIRDFSLKETVGRIRSGMIQYPSLTEGEKDGEYDAYLQEMGRRGFEPLSMEEFLYYRDFKNIDSVIQDMLEMFGLESIKEV